MLVNDKFLSTLVENVIKCKKSQYNHPLGCLSSSFSTVWSTYSKTRCSRFLRLKTSNKFTRFGCLRICNVNTTLLMTVHIN